MYSVYFSSEGFIGIQSMLCLDKPLFFQDDAKYDDIYLDVLTG